MPVKTDRKDALGIAQLMRLGWFRSVHCKSLPVQEVRALLTARELRQAKSQELEMSLRGCCVALGGRLARRYREASQAGSETVADNAPLSTVVEALLAAHGMLFERWQKLEKRLDLWRARDQSSEIDVTGPHFQDRGRDGGVLTAP